MRFWDKRVILALVINVNTDNKNEIAEKILCLMKEKAMSYGELAAQTGIPKSALQRYATGATTKLPLPRLEAIASALGVSAAYLMGWEDAPDSKEKPSEDEKTAPELSESVKKLINVMSQLTPENQRIVLAAAKGFLQEQNEGEDK